MKRITFCLLLLSTGAYAEDIPWYTVEMLVFSRTDPGAGETEHWPYDPGFPELADAIDLDNPKQARPPAKSTSAPIPYQRLSHSQLTLGKARNKIDKSKNYQLTLHMAWRQQGLPANLKSALPPLACPVQPQSVLPPTD